MPLLVLLFILLPTLELVLLIKLGSYIGALATVAIVFITAVVGASLLRREGFSTLMKAQSRLESGEMPAREVAEGALLVVAGAFLLTPGFITDLVGFACLIQPLRARMADALLKRMTLQMGQVNIYTNAAGQQPGPSQDAIEGEFQRRE
jgi:UPF0716 protein FxsA